MSKMKAYAEQVEIAKGGRNHFFYALCQVHGMVEHLTWLDGACMKCHIKHLNKKGLIKDDK